MDGHTAAPTDVQEVILNNERYVSTHKVQFIEPDFKIILNRTPGFFICRHGSRGVWFTKYDFGSVFGLVLKKSAVFGSVFFKNLGFRFGF